MTNYYIRENNIITQSANWKFSDDCLETEEEIVRYNGQLYLASEYAALQATDEYKAEQKKQLIQSELAKYKNAINDITNARLIDDLQHDNNLITDAVYNSRKITRANQYNQVRNTYYTNTGLTPPATITA